MKVMVDKDLCVGCGSCASICSEIFELNDDGFADVKTEDNNVKEEYEKEVQMAVESCPTEAIKEIKE